jgi:hypothetical protein
MESKQQDNGENCTNNSQTKMIKKLKDEYMGEGCTTHGRYEICIQNCSGKRKGKTEAGRSMWRRWEDNIEMNPRDVGWEDCRPDSSDSGQRSKAGCCEYSNEPSSSITGEEFDKMSNC